MVTFIIFFAPISETTWVNVDAVDEDVSTQPFADTSVPGSWYNSELGSSS